MVYCVYSLESPRWGDSNVNTQHTFMLKKIKISLLSLLTWRYNRPSLARTTCLELIFMVPKVFEPLKFDHIWPELNIIFFLCNFTFPSNQLLKPDKHIKYIHLAPQCRSKICRKWQIWKSLIHMQILINFQCFGHYATYFEQRFASQFLLLWSQFHPKFLSKFKAFFISNISIHHHIKHLKIDSQKLWSTDMLLSCFTSTVNI